MDLNFFFRCLFSIGIYLCETIDVVVIAPYLHRHIIIIIGGTLFKSSAYSTDKKIIYKHAIRALCPALW